MELERGIIFTKTPLSSEPHFLQNPTSFFSKIPNRSQSLAVAEIRSGPEACRNPTASRKSAPATGRVKKPHRFESLLPHLSPLALPRKLNTNVGKKAAKDPNKPKRAPSAFFVFMEGFRQQYKEKHPKNKSVSAVGKAVGEKWKSMSDEVEDVSWGRLGLIGNQNHGVEQHA